MRTSSPREDALGNLRQLYKTKQRSMVRLGQPDLIKTLLLQPQRRDLAWILPETAFAAIKTCCRRRLADKRGCHNSVCPRCSTIQRTALALQACVADYDQRLRAVMMTYVPQNKTAQQGGLVEIDGALAVAELRRAFADAWVGIRATILVVGSPDVSFNEDPRNLHLKLAAAEKKRRHFHQLHFHFVIISEDPEALAANLRIQLLAGRAAADGEFMVNPTYCLGRTVMYCTKIRPVRRAAGLDDLGNHRPKSRPLARAPKLETVRWLAGLKETERVFTFYSPGRTAP